MKSEPNFKPKILTIVILLILTAISLTGGINSIIKANSEVYNLYELNASQITDGVRVNGDINYVLDAFANYSDDESIDYQYYVICAGKNNEFFIGMEASPDTFDALDEQIYATYDAIESNTELAPLEGFKIKGVIRKMDGKMLDFYTSYFSDVELYTQEEVQDELGVSIMPYFIDIDRGEFDALPELFAPLLFGVAAIWNILSLIKLKKFYKAQAGYSYSASNSRERNASDHDNFTVQSSAKLSGGMQDEKKPPMGFEE